MRFTPTARPQPRQPPAAALLFPSICLALRSISSLRSRPLDGVRSGDLASTVLRRIAGKLGLSAVAASKVRLFKAGKQLASEADCGLVKGDTVHLVGGLHGGAHTKNTARRSSGVAPRRRLAQLALNEMLAQPYPPPGLTPSQRVVERDELRVLHGCERVLRTC